MRRVLVDLLFYTGTKGGMESYAREVYSRLSPDDPDLEYVGLASRELAATDTSWFPGRVVDSGISGEDRVAWARGELFSLGGAARRHEADLVHCPANFGPWRSGVPVVLTVHDLLAFRHPEYVPGAYSRVLRWMIRVAARRASRILTVSRASRDDIVRYLGVPAERVVVTPLAGSRPGGDDADAGAGAGAIERREASLLAVGNRMPHKGFETLLEALARIDADERPRLTITGSHGDDPLAPHRRPAGPGRSGRPARLAEPRRAGASLLGVDRARLPDALRGLRPPAPRGDVTRVPRHRLRPAGHARGGGRRRGVRGSRRSRGDRRRDPVAARDPAERERMSRDLCHAHDLLWQGHQEQITLCVVLDHCEVWYNRASIHDVFAS